MNKKVCVIGAGPSGLVTVKELLHQNIEVVCYDAQETHGGAFRDVNKGGRSYKSLKLTVSNYFMAYSDFMPDNKEERKFWDFLEYQKYLQDYMNRFGLDKHVFYAHRVTKANIEDHKVVLQISHKGEIRKEFFDHLIICSGSNYQPLYPKLTGRSIFKGSIIHSSEYSDSENFRNKKVVCIGLGESGVDIVHEVCQITDCKVLVRDFPNIVPRWIKGFTSDAYTAHLINAMGKQGIDHFMKLKAWFYLNFDKKLDESGRLIQQWISARESFTGKFLTKNDIFVKDVVSNTLEIVKDEIDFLTEKGLVTKEGKTIAADVLIFNTGYKTSFDQFSFGIDFENPRNLFKQMIHPNYGALISLIGWARPSQGGLPACSEMQARYISLLISNKKQAVPLKKMKATILRDTFHYEQYFSNSLGIKSLVNYHDFMKEMAVLIGCRPKIFSFKNSSLLPKLFFGSHLPVFYRLDDPNYKSAAVSIIKSLPIAYSNRRILVILFFIIVYRPIFGLMDLGKKVFKHMLRSSLL